MDSSNHPQSSYAIRRVGDMLTQCLAEVCERRPPDPIEYIALWIYKHRENEIRYKQLASEKAALQRQKVAREHMEYLMLLGRPGAPEPVSSSDLNTAPLNSNSVMSFSPSSSFIDRISHEQRQPHPDLPDVLLDTGDRSVGIREDEISDDNDNDLLTSDTRRLRLDSAGERINRN